MIRLIFINKYFCEILGQNKEVEGGQLELLLLFKGDGVFRFDVVEVGQDWLIGQLWQVKREELLRVRIEFFIKN